MYKLEWSCKSNFLLSWLQFCLYPNHDFALRNRFYTGYISICSSVPTHPSVIPVSKVPKSLSMFVNPHKIRGDGNSKPKKIQHLSGLEKLRVVCVDRREFQLVLIYVRSYGLLIFVRFTMRCIERQMFSIFRFAIGFTFPWLLLWAGARNFFLASVVNLFTRIVIDFFLSALFYVVTRRQICILEYLKRK